MLSKSEVENIIPKVCAANIWQTIHELRDTALELMNRLDWLKEQMDKLIKDLHENNI